MDKAIYSELCNHVGWTDPPRFGKCVPTQQGTKQTTQTTTPICIQKLRDGYRIPRKATNTIQLQSKDANTIQLQSNNTNTNPTTPTDIEDSEIASEDEAPKPQVASKICKVKRARSESPAQELRIAIELLERANNLEQQARQLREEATEIRHRYDRYKR